MKPLFENLKLPDKTKLISSDPWEDRKMILEIFCGYHEDKGFRGIFKKSDFKDLMFWTTGSGKKIDNFVLRQIYEKVVNWDKYGEIAKQKWASKKFTEERAKLKANSK